MAEVPLRSCLSFQVLEKTRLLQQNKVQLVEAQMGQWSLGAHKTKRYGMDVPASVHLVCWKEPVLCPMGASVTWVNPWPARQVNPFQHPFLHTWHEFKGGMCHIRYFSPMPSPPGSTHPWPGEGVQIQSSDVGASLPKSLVGEPGRKPQVEGLPHYSCWQMDVLNVPHPIRIKHPPHVPSFAERWDARNPARKWLACRRRRRKNVPRRCQPQMRTDKGSKGQGAWHSTVQWPYKWA